MSDIHHCKNTESTAVRICEAEIFIPNAFSPNHDGTNDRFEMLLQGVKSYELRIFDRWGGSIAILHTDTWTGENCPEGVYSYLLEAQTFDNQYIQRAGTITIVR